MINISDLQMSHDVQNEVYVTAKTEVLSAPQIDEDKLTQISNNRLDELFKILTPITAEAILEMPSYVELVDLFVSFFDDVIIECALLTGRRAETEKKILDLCKEALGQPTADKTRNTKDEHIVSAFIDALILHEAPVAARASSLAKALMDDTNPLRLGLTFYKIFCERYPNEGDPRVLQYFTLEEGVRLALLTGDAADATEKMAKLFELPINTPERYLLMSLNSFYNGFVDDAKRVLELGLNAFPGNVRLLSAKEGL